MAVADTKVALFKDHFWHFQIKIKFQKKIKRQGSIQLTDADFFGIIPWHDQNDQRQPKLKKSIPLTHV